MVGVPFQEVSTGDSFLHLLPISGSYARGQQVVAKECFELRWNQVVVVLLIHCQFYNIYIYIYIGIGIV